MTSRAIFTILGIIVLIILAVWLFGRSSVPETTNVIVPNPTTTNTGNTPSSTTSPTTSATDTATGTGQTENVVTYTSAGFTPQTITISSGETVQFVNESSDPMWVASAQHPTHTVYSGTSREEHCGNAAESTAFDQCNAGASFSFTFDKVGTWNYHNHLDPADRGTVVVQ